MKQKYQATLSNVFAHSFFRCPFLTPRNRGSRSDGRLPTRFADKGPPRAIREKLATSNSGSREQRPVTARIWRVGACAPNLSIREPALDSRAPNLSKPVDARTEKNTGLQYTKILLISSSKIVSQPSIPPQIRGEKKKKKNRRPKK